MRLSDLLVFATCALALAFAVGLFTGRASVAEPAPTIPTCVEDVVLLGVGNFENGHWDAYVCGPAADDFVGFDR